MLKTIIITYFLIGFLKVILLFVPQDTSHRSYAVSRKRYDLLLFSIIMWLPMFLLDIKQYGVKRAFRFATSAIRHIVEEYKTNKKLKNNQKQNAK
jgi:hypothetical protein